MTLVMAFNWLSEVVIVADTRVSYQNNVLPPQDVLKKLYVIQYRETNQNLVKGAVIGFSGSIFAAKIIIENLVHKIRNYKREFVLGTFKDDLHKWLNEISIAKLSSEYRNLKIILCGMEPSRHPRVFQDGKFIGYILPFCESHLYTYRINKDNGMFSIQKNGNLAIIGSGLSTKFEEGNAFDLIEQKFSDLIGFAFKQPNLQWARAQILSEEIAYLYKEVGERTVGGPFQYVRITPTEIIENYALPFDAERITKIENNGPVTRLYSSDGNYTLYPVWMYPPPHSANAIDLASSLDHYCG